MGLSEYERSVLRQLDADLDRQDPRLRWELTRFTVLDGDAEASWRPPRTAVIVAAVVLACGSFMLAAVTMLMRQPCPAAGDAETTAATTAPAPPGTSPGSVVRDLPPPAPRMEPAATAHTRSRPSSPSTC